MAVASLILAVVGLLVAVASASFSAIAWWRSGSMVRIDDSDGVLLKSDGTSPPRLPVDDPMFVYHADPPNVRIYRIINVGRQDTAILDWWIDFGGPETEGELVATASVQATATPPTTIRAGHLIELAIPLLRLDKAAVTPKPKNPDPCLVVRLGTGRTEASKRRSVPAMSVSGFPKSAGET